MAKDMNNEIEDVFIVDKSYNRMLRFYRWDKADSRYEICCDGIDMEKFLNAIPAMIPYNYYLVILHKDGTSSVCRNLATYNFDDSGGTPIKKILSFDYDTRKYKVHWNKTQLEEIFKQNFLEKRTDN